MKRVAVGMPDRLFDRAAIVAWHYRHPSTDSFLSGILMAALENCLADTADKWRVPDNANDQDKGVLLLPESHRSEKDDNR